ncbi:MAG: GntR family transcriptional regulator [Anaerovoracaceae bacterium]
MITFDQFKLEDGMPIYLQIVLYIKRGIIAGVIADGDELPSRRILSALLGVNPNTVQKTYRLLEDEGLIQSHAGAKSYMVLDEEKVRRIRQELLEGDARNIVSAMKQMGLSLDEASALLKKYWD